MSPLTERKVLTTVGLAVVLGIDIGTVMTARHIPGMLGLVAVPLGVVTVIALGLFVRSLWRAP